MQLRPEAGETCRAEAMEWDSVVGRHARRRERAGVGRATEPERGGACRDATREIPELVEAGLSGGRAAMATARSGRAISDDGIIGSDDDGQRMQRL